MSKYPLNKLPVTNDYLQNMSKPQLYTSLSPSLFHLYDATNSIVVIIDVLRATSTIAAALYNGAQAIIPVESVQDCVHMGKQLNAITAGERDGKIAEGLQHGNSPLEYPSNFIKNKTLVLTTTNGTRMLHMALEKGAQQIITGSFPNLSAVCEYLITSNLPVILGCSAWKDKINIEDMLFAGAVIDRLKNYFTIHCDASHIARNLYQQASTDCYTFMQQQKATHYHRLINYGLEEDIRYCLTADIANILPKYKEGKLIIT